MQINRIYEVLLEGTLPVIAKIRIEADSEWQAGILAERVVESQGVKTTALEIEAYPAAFFVVEGVSEVTPIDPNDSDQKVWNREEIELLLSESTATGGIDCS